MVEVNGRLQHLVGGVLVDVEGTDDAGSPTGKALPVLDAEGRASLVLVVTRLTSLLAELQLKADFTESQPVIGPLTDTQLRASAPAVKDDYQAGECLAEQTGDGTVKDFTFATPVQLVHVEANGADTDVARVDPFGGAPTATKGFRAADGVGIYLPVTCTIVKVWAPVGMVVTVQGFRRA